MTRIDDPIVIGGCSIRNRLYRAPVLEGAGDGPDAPDIYAEAFGANAHAGVGLIIQGNSCVYPEGRSSAGMTVVDSRDHTLRLRPVTDAVHAAGGRIFLQIGHAGIYALEAWHSAFAATRSGPVLAVSKPRVHIKPALRGVPLKILSTQEVYDFATATGDSAAWAREAGYDGVQIASSNAKFVHQFLSPYYNRRNDEFGGNLRNRARILQVIAASVRRAAGDDFPLTVKIPMGEDAPPLAPHTSVAQGLELCSIAEDLGYDAITPVGLSVFPHASLARGAYPGTMLDVRSIRTRLEEALGGSRLKMAILRWGYKRAAKAYPFEPVWNRSFFTAARKAVSIPVFAVGGIRTRAECDAILESGEADMVGIGRPFYAEPQLAARILRGPDAEALCESSNRCVPAQQLGMKARCYNARVAVKRKELEHRS